MLAVVAVASVSIGGGAPEPILVSGLDGGGLASGRLDWIVASGSLGHSSSRCHGMVLSEDECGTGAGDFELVAVRGKVLDQVADAVRRHVVGLLADSKERGRVKTFQ